MELTRDTRIGRVYCKDDPELWVQRFLPNQRVNLPYRFILSIDGRRIGLAVAEWLSDPQNTGPKQSEFDRPTIIIRHIGLRVSGVVTVDTLTTNASRFASREQQDRAIEFFLGAFEHMPPMKHVTGEILPQQARFAPEIQARLERGDFIE